jgi:hypothetical protein
MFLLLHYIERYRMALRQELPFLTLSYFTVGATSGAGTVYHAGAPEFTPGFSVGRVVQPLVFCVVFCILLLVLFLLVIGRDRLVVVFATTYAISTYHH